MCVCIKSNHFSVHLKRYSSSTPVFKKQQNGYSETTDMQMPGQEITDKTEYLRSWEEAKGKLWKDVKTVTYKEDSGVHSPREDMCSEKHLREIPPQADPKAQTPYTSVKVFPGVQQWKPWERGLFSSNAQCSTKYHEIQRNRKNKSYIIEEENNSNHL